MERTEKFPKRAYPPIVSYGIILYRMEKNIPYFLLYQRRDTFEYTDFIRGIWTSENHLFNLFRSMSMEERDRIRNYTFRELWDDIWVHQECRVYKDGYQKAKKKYDAIKKKIPYILDRTDTYVLEPPWGFPKGKKNGYLEDSIKCALREFTEETRIDPNRIHIVGNFFFTENFKGSNNKFYTTHYYLAETDSKDLPEPYETSSCIRKYTLSDEASEIKWCTMEELSSLLNIKRINIVKSILPIIEERKKNLDNKNELQECP